MCDKMNDRIIPVRTGKSYTVKIGRGLLSHIGQEVAAFAPGKAVIVSDDCVFALYGNTVADSLTAAGFSVLTFVFPHGEASKNPDTLFALWRFLAAETVTRSDTLFALGGGVTGDLCGFAAATYLRGVRYVQIPTTLLAMVDSSVGGKTAVDLPEGKNQVGAFYQPAAVLCDPSVLSTLPPEEFRCGMAEVIKYAFINESALLPLLQKESLSPEDLSDVIELSVRDKAAIVSRDETDEGCRQLLNLGHTLGHGVEKLSGYRVPHGDAVAIGMVLVTQASVAHGLCPREAEKTLLRLLRKWGLPTTSPYPIADLCAGALGDKKRKGNKITLVVPYGIADSRLYPIAVDTMVSFFTAGGKIL